MDNYTPAPNQSRDGLSKHAQSYYEHIELWHPNEWPEWVVAVNKAILTGNEATLSGFLPWVRAVFSEVYPIELNKKSCGDV